jgi:hypothetical protein
MNTNSDDNLMEGQGAVTTLSVPFVGSFNDQVGIPMYHAVYNFDFNHDLIALPCSVSVVLPKRKEMMGSI